MKKHPLAFLTMGRSLIRLKDRAGVYKLPTGKTFPEFGTSGRRKEVLPSAVRAPAPATQTNLFEAPKTHVAVAPEAPVAPIKTMPVPVPFSTAKVISAPKLAEPSFFSRASVAVWRWWFQFSKKFFGSGWKLRVPKVFQFGGQSMAHDSRPRAQTELALEQVTVLRNDLSEADVTVVKVAAKKEKLSDAGGPAVSKAWSRATARWIKGKSPQNEGGTMPEGPTRLPELQP
jgi:hypothetical protein